MTRVLSSLTALVAAGVLVAGCGSDDSSSGGGGAQATTPAPAPASTTSDDGASTSTSTSSSSSNGYGGSGAGSASGGGSSSLTLAADEKGGLSFDRKSLSAKAGTVTITMDNPSGDSLPHAIAVEGPGGVDSDGQIAQPGGTSKVSLKLKPGKYTFYCPVGSHRAAGMEGTLTVR